MRSRVLTALILAPLVLLACWIRTPYPLFGVCLLALTLAFWELRTLARQPKALPVVTLFSLVIPFFGIEIQNNREPLQIILYAGIFWLVGVYFAFRSTRKLVGSSEVDLAGLWISMPLTCLLMLHKLAPEHPATLFQGKFIFLILVPLWIGDIGALLVGQRFGRHLLWPAVSPKKSWEGAIANLILCVGVAALLTQVLQDPSKLLVHCACGAAIGIFGQAGDLFESYLKRKANVKDSGSILPGHGGILDRIDSLLFAAPITSVILVLFFSRA